MSDQEPVSPRQTRFSFFELERTVIVSSTNRGAVRIESDLYETPPEPIIQILNALDLPGGDWLEPSAGSGAIIRAVNSVRSDVRWTACEILPEMARMICVADPSADVVCDDFLTADWLVRWDVCAMNPPFSLALQFIERALEVADWVVCLERLNFLGSDKRNEFWLAHMPDVYVLPRRPSFVGGKTDSTEYALFVWPKGGHNREEGKTRVLPSVKRK